MTTKILNQSQAEAVYSAMCYLNNVGGMLSVHIRADTGHFIEVHEGSSGAISVTHVHDQEKYANQSAFATAYGLQQG